MVLFFHVILEDHMMKELPNVIDGSCGLLWEVTTLLCFGGNRPCGSRDIMLLVVEKQNSTCSCLAPPLLLIPKALALSWSQLF